MIAQSFGKKKEKQVLFVFITHGVWVLKERFNSFNGMFEVSDEQLQSELRVSVTALVVPAYRSFFGRFQQYFSPGRQTEKYIEYAPEELETFIDDLADGNAASMVRRT